jgi:predicted nucleic acid-binding protein
LTSESKNFRVLLDTKPIIKLFAKEEGWEAVQKILVQIENSKVEAAISVVTLTEIYYKYLHEKRPELAKARVEELRFATYLKKVDIDEKIAIKAGDFKGKHSIPIGDSLIAASAFYLNATVITDDLDFKKITEVNVQSETEFLSLLKEEKQ